MGAISAAVQFFKENAIEMTNLREEQEADRVKAEEEKRQAMLAMADSFEGSIGSVANGVTSAATEMESMSRSVSQTAATAGKKSDAVAEAALQANTGVQSAASAAEELTASIGKIARQVESSSSIASEAVDQIARINETVNGLRQAGQSIGLLYVTTMQTGD